MKYKFRETLIEGLFFIVSIFLYAYIGFFSRYRLIFTEVLLILMIFYSLFNSKRKLHYVNIGWILFFLYIIFSFIIKNRTTGLNYVMMLGLGLLLLQVKIKEKHYSIIFNQIYLLSFLFSLLTILNKFFIEKYMQIITKLIYENQMKTIVNNINLNGMPGLAGETSFNAFCINMGLLLIYSKITSDKKLNFYDFVNLFIALIAIYFTGKRSMLFISLILLLVSILIRDFKKNKVYLFMVPSFLLFIMIVAEKYVKVFFDYILSRGGTVSLLNNREWFWQIAKEMFVRNPFLGEGINTYDFIYNIRKESQGYIGFAGAHNSYIQFLAELGIIGLFIFLISVMIGLHYTLKNIKKYKKHSKSWMLYYSLFGQITVLFLALSENPFYQPQQLIFYFYCISLISNAFYLFNGGKNNVK